MNPGKPAQSALSTADAFFVAYQQGAGILMQQGFELELKGKLERADLEAMLSHVTGRWPQLGQAVQRRIGGLVWQGECRVAEMLRVETGESGLQRWRNEPMDPFREPPFQILWVRGEEREILSVRGHHAVLDGEAMFTVYLEMLKVLANAKGGRPLPLPVAVMPARLAGLGESLRPLCSGKMWSHLRKMSKEAKGGGSARMAVRNGAPGPTATCERLLDAEESRNLAEQAARHGTQPLWFTTAAWMRALHAWNKAAGAGGNSTISLEFPVSLRRGKVSKDCLGNLISPLMLMGDAALPVGALAQTLKEQFSHSIREQLHLTMPRFTAPLRFLPWAIFRRLVMTPLATGFATSHFTWHENKNDVGSNVSDWSGGRLELLGRRVYTPVCLHMGVALLVVASAGATQLSISHRLNAFSHDDAERLADLLQSELMQSSTELAEHDGK
ncbi:MAG: Condensation domain protein [Pedosphaera sp.]|nr:Condensation domain protein [Pedosphaera sp.]